MIETNTQSSQIRTKDRILDAAEKLFAMNGFEATSLRQITTEAGVNLAAVNYHFQSKEALLGAVFSRRVIPLNRQRLACLDALEAAAGPEGPALESILDALFRPVIEAAKQVHFIPKLIMRVQYIESTGAGHDAFEEHFREVIQRFVSALRKAVPHIPQQEFLWRVQFVIGSFVHVMTVSQVSEMISGSRATHESHELAIKLLVQFAAAGLRAAPTELHS